MFIQTEATPNPATVKFLPGRPVMTKGTADYRSADSAAASPLARRLFDVGGVGGVFLGSDFIAVTKHEDSDWAMLKTHILAEIMQHFTTGLPVVEDVADEGVEDNDPVIAQIREILDTRVRPAVAADGGDVVFGRFENGILYLRMQGACAGCPSASATLKMGIENLMKHYVPEVRAVEPDEEWI